MKQRFRFAFESLFLIRPVQPIGDEKKTVYFMEDQGMASWLAERGLSHPIDIVRGIYANLRQELHYRPEREGKILQYRTKHGVEVPLVFKAKNIEIGIICSPERELAPKTLASASRFLSEFPSSKVIIAYGGSEPVFKNSRHFWIPFYYLC